MSECIYCGDPDAHPGTRKCSDSTACDLRALQGEYDSLFKTVDPRSLEVIADEIEHTPYGAMRARSLRLIAASQRAAIAKAGGK